MQKITLVLLCTFLFVSNSICQFVNDVKYLLEFNESNCRYEVYLYVESGTVTTPFFRTQASAQISFVAPSDASITIGSRYNPKRLDNGSPNFWNIGTYDIAPAIDPTHNYYSVTPALSPTSRYDHLVEGDTILLFDLLLTNPQHGQDPIRLYENGVDLNSTDGLGGNFNNGMTIGSPTQIYNGNLPQVKPPLYADLEGPSSIFDNYTTQLAPATGGTWVNEDPAIVSIDPAGVVTGLSAGLANLTFQANGSSCISNTKINVISEATANCVGIGTSDPHPSAILDLTSTDKGLLLPRMSAIQRLNLPSPAEGLIVYQNTGDRGIYFYSGNQWRVLSDDPASNSIVAGGGNTASSLSKETSGSEVEMILEQQSQLSKKLEQQTAHINKLMEALQK